MILCCEMLWAYARREGKWMLTRSSPRWRRTTRVCGETTRRKRNSSPHLEVTSGEQVKSEKTKEKCWGVREVGVSPTN